MAVKGIEIKAGQIWSTKCGDLVTILRPLSEPTLFTWLAADDQAQGGQIAYTSDGSRWPAHESERDLDKLLGTVVFWGEDALAFDFVEPAASGDSTVTNTFGPLEAPDFHTSHSPVKQFDKTDTSRRSVHVRKCLDAETSPATAANDPQVGDINSDAKGSGARFNAGKAPFDLVPLWIIADWYEMESWSALNEVESGPVGALLSLGRFQARSDDDHTSLMSALLALDDGWEECARVFEYGAKKYKKENWCKGMAWSVPLACATRHLIAMINGEACDPESGLSHRGHAYCNLVMLLTFMDTYIDGDDRPAAGLFLGNKESA